MSVLLDKFEAMSKAQAHGTATDSAVRPQVSQEDVRAFQMHLQGGNQLSHLTSAPQKTLENARPSHNTFSPAALSQPMGGELKYQHLAKPGEGANAFLRMEQANPMTNTSMLSMQKPMDNINRPTAFDSLSQPMTSTKETLVKPQHYDANVREFINEMKPQSTMSTKETLVKPQNYDANVREFLNEMKSQSTTSTKETLVKPQNYDSTVKDFANEMKSQLDVAPKPTEPSIDTLFKDFAAMAAQMDALATPTSQSAEVQAKPAAGLDAVNLNELVSRILVNTPDNGKAEVRLTLQDNVLRGTEISITRDTDGLLTVRITTDNAASFQTLVASRNDLQAILQQQEGRMVNVQMLDESQREQNDSRRRSKGLREDEEEKDD
ncbi:MAG: hypothetical protein IIV95_06820 [Burkholderiaceae bacterium]|nr:hypothetical protein [Burkholderiaceae bacterium]